MSRIIAVMVLLCGFGLAADRHKLSVDAESTDGLLLQRIQQEPAADRKLVLLQQYVKDYPKTESFPWVLEQLLTVYVAGNQPALAFQTAQALLAVDPNDLDSLNVCLRYAEATKNSELMSHYAELCWDAGTRGAKVAAPKDPDDIPEWKTQIEFAKQLAAYSEYVMYSQASLCKDAEQKAVLLQALTRRNPQSRYLQNTKREYTQSFPTGNPEHAYELAEQGLRQDPNNEDFLMTVAQHFMQREQEFDRVMSLSHRTIEVLHSKPMPENALPSDWERKKLNYLGMSNWMIGVIHGRRGEYALSDRFLRASLPYIRHNEPMLAAAYFYLGYANYALADSTKDRSRAQEAIKFNRQCVAMNSPFHELAQKNLDVIKNEYNLE